MKISEIKSELLSTLKPYVSSQGFKVNKTQFCLKRDGENNECQFSFDYTRGVMKFTYSLMFK